MPTQPTSQFSLPWPLPSISWRVSLQVTLGLSILCSLLSTSLSGLLVPLPGFSSDSLHLHLYSYSSPQQTWAQILGHMPIGSKCKFSTVPQRPVTPGLCPQVRQ